MNCWEVLEIAPTGDARALKKAYTRLLRKYPPEADPEGFQRLRTAYEEARFLLQYGLVDASADGNSAAAQELPPETGGSGGSPEAGAPESIGTGEPDADWEPLPAPPPSPEAESILAQVREDFPDHALRQSEDYWKRLASSEILWNLDAKAELGAGLFRFLGETYLAPGKLYTDIHVPKESWKVLDDAFGWLENEGEWYARFPEDLANAVLDRVRAARNLALSTDLKGGYAPARDLLIDGGGSAAKYRWLGWLLWVIVVMALNGVFFRCN